MFFDTRPSPRGRGLWRKWAAGLALASCLALPHTPAYAQTEQEEPGIIGAVDLQVAALYQSYQSVMEQNPIGLVSWAQADEMLPRDTQTEVIDVETGRRFFIQRIYGTLHADSVPLTQADTDTLRALYDGTYSWDRRAILVKIGARYYAASMNGMPHGNGIKGNGYPGHFCIHFAGSLTHGGRRVCPLHQQKIQAAYENGAQWLSLEERLASLER